ncbi:gag-pol polyprotein [Cucumis melo var. makuwa]|uniref:Gag-pol polyprotein n=1 Tax=Cucumis melo var. makuwa TaxID=1194695 RepID=A0A5D3CES7_CUCMM|nr:gag-pol polyprotein [Cucumis melo var. makuwa]
MLHVFENVPEIGYHLQDSSRKLTSRGRGRGKSKLAGDQKYFGIHYEMFMLLVQLNIWITWECKLRCKDEQFEEVFNNFLKYFQSGTSRLQILTFKFESLKMIYDEPVGDYNVCVLDTVNEPFALGKILSEQKLVKKVFCSLPKCFDMKITTIEEVKRLALQSVSDEEPHQDKGKIVDEHLVDSIALLTKFTHRRVSTTIVAMIFVVVTFRITRMFTVKESPCLARMSYE